jgi:hypothetical protein
MFAIFSSDIKKRLIDTADEKRERPAVVNINNTQASAQTGCCGR